MDLYIKNYEQTNTQISVLITVAAKVLLKSLKKEYLGYMYEGIIAL